MFNEINSGLMSTPKPVLILLHGALASERQFDDVIDVLNARFDVRSLNFEGHGGRPTDRDFSINNFVQNLLDCLEEKDLKDVAIFGYSMGGYVALKAALRTSRIGKIVTLATKFDWSIASTQKEVMMLNPEGIEAKVPQYAEQLKQVHAPFDWKVVVRQTAIMMTKLSEGERLKAEDLQQIQNKVVVGIGDKDRMVTITESENAAASLPNAELVVLEGVKHPLDRISSEQLSEYIITSIAD